MIGYFGKLPSSADFIRHHASGSDLQAFDECLQAAMLRLAAEGQWEENFDRLPRCSFLYRATTQYWLAGELISSHDLSGRRYPLMTFQRLPVQTNGHPFHGAWTLCEIQARQIGELLQDVVYGHGDVKRFAESIQALRPLTEADQQLHQRLHLRVLDDLRLCDISDAMSKGYPEFIANGVLHRMTGLKALCERMTPPPVVLPLPPERALMRPVADIWSHWLTMILPEPPTLMLLVHDFMRPCLWGFGRTECSRMYQLLAGMGTRQQRFDVLESFDQFDPQQVQTALPDPQQSIGRCMARYTGYDDRA